MHNVRKVWHYKMKSAHPGSAPGSATGLCCHLKLMKYKRVQIRGHYFASYCETLSLTFCQSLKLQMNMNIFQLGRTYENQDQSSLMLKS